MTAWRRWRVAIAAAALVSAAPALGSGGDPEWFPTYIHINGGSPAEQRQFFSGRLGVVLPAASDGMLFAQWRLLHGLSVGTEAGAGLAERCCDFEAYGHEESGFDKWTNARKLIRTAPPIAYIRTERYTDDYRWVATCHSDAMDRAAATLRDRVRSHGAGSPHVRAWLGIQDAVFDACANEKAALPALPSNAPIWLQKDYAYQHAAFTFYSQRFSQAADLFGAIARDPQSPWQPLGLYLVARSRYHDQLAAPSPEHLRLARDAFRSVQSLPAGSYGRPRSERSFGRLIIGNVRTN